MNQLQRFIVLGIGLFFGVLACREYHWLVWVFGVYLGIAAVELLIMMARWRLGQPAKKTSGFRTFKPTAPADYKSPAAVKVPPPLK